MTDTDSHPFTDYINALLPFQAPSCLEDLPPPLSHDLMLRAVQRIVRAASRETSAGAFSHVLLLGLGSGLLAQELHQALPPAIELTVAELQPWRVTTLLQKAPERLAWLHAPRCRLLSDNSPWALLLLLQAIAGLKHLHPLRNPELREQDSATRFGLLQKLLVLGQEETAPQMERSAPPAVSAAAIVHPQEPDIEGFLRQFPAWLEELVLIWDAEAPPAHNIRPAPKLRELARPLNGDFAAQRNAMLEACRGDWVLFLDCDERLSSESWERIPRLASHKTVQGYWFPRRTFYGDEQHVLAGLGLWPDLQLRLVRNVAGLRFERPVHERLRGLEGAVAIPPGLPILHYNQLKDSQQIDAKYSLFSQAGGERHVRSQDYPHLDLAFFKHLEQATGPDLLLTLRYNPAL